jgi:phosphatidylglycerophosphate synthase
MPQRFALEEIRARTCKDRDAWWTVWLVDPVAVRLVRLVAPYRWITPNRITGVAFLLGLAAALAFARATPAALAVGALLFHVSFVLDCMDGKIARLNGTGSVFGVWLDFVLDRVKALICAIGLFGGQFAATGRLAYLWVGGGVIFLDLFRYVNSAQLAKVRGTMRAELALYTGEPVDQPEPTADDNVDPDFNRRFGLFARVRNALIRQRVRAHLISGIEFEMAVFIIAPLTTLVLAVPITAGALLIAFELLLIYKLLAATRSYPRRLQDAMQHRHVGDRLEAELSV